MHVKKDDLVEVIAGEDAARGKAHRVLRVLPEANKVIVEGVNRVYKHVKPNRRNPQGGRLSLEAPVAVSNVMLFCPNCKKGVRFGKKITPDGRKHRECKKCKGDLGTISSAKANIAKK
ncbi:MAG: 50S ribosomal protein L24 [Gemmataceae bacterium]|nr:50S ribosomal protein L24 [Gemmataceae bacterium]